MDLISIPLKRTSPAKFTDVLSLYIQQSYAEPPEAYLDDLRVLDGMREAAVLSFDNTSDFNSSFLDRTISFDIELLISTFNRYYGQLSLIFTKFPPNTDIEFHWGNAFNSDITIKQTDLWYERAAILFNVGAIYSQIAVKSLTSDSNGYKFAFNNLQLSAGAFNFLRSKILIECRNQMTEDLDIPSLVLLEKLMIAQAQECSFFKAVSDKMKNKNIAKIAKSVSDFYQICLDSIRNSSLPINLFQGWEDQISFKVCYYEAVVHYRCSCDSLENGKYGAEISHLEIARDRLSSALNRTINDSLSRSTNDNDLIYLDYVPPAHELPVVSGFKMANLIIPEVIADPARFVDKEELGSPLFRALVPLVVHQAASLYEERKEQYIRMKIILPLDELSADDAMDSVDKPIGIPPQIMLGADQIKSEGGFLALQKLNTQLANDRQKVASMLKESEASLNREFEADQKLRNLYQNNGVDLKRTHSSELTSSYFSSINIFNETLIKAIDNDSFISQKMESWKQYILLLESGREKIMLSLPNSSSSDLLSSSQNKTVLSRLRQYFNETVAMFTERSEKMQNLKDQLANDDINSELISEVDSLYKKANSPFIKIELSHFEPLFSDKLSAYTEWHKYYSNEVEKQKEMFDSLVEANLAFIAARKQNSVVNKRETALGNLQLAIDRFHEIMKNLNEGIYFYQKLINGVGDVRRRCADYCMARNVEADELTAQLLQQGYNIDENFKGVTIDSNRSNFNNDSSGGMYESTSTNNLGGNGNSTPQLSNSQNLNISSWDPSTPLKYNSPRK
ncbi:pH-response regulator protein palA/RIM20 [Smittium culicis]|uniref:pH-response regulator protein palA/RIM20 n=1 Tax=Smittium culicis TaxID=133412 RepID=A0A1R1XVK6_9FUNG|nr:pH-response regulator protein palA/RIM20 [Smittium culicis]